jgi:ferritin-like metal-binding protein YciE
MPIKDPRELFVKLLSHVRHGTERSAAIYKELGEAAQNPEIREALTARTFVSQQNLEKLDEAFKMLGEKPVGVTGPLHDVFVEDFRKELAEIQSPASGLQREDEAFDSSRHRSENRSEGCWLT